LFAAVVLARIRNEGSPRTIAAHWEAAFADALRSWLEKENLSVWQDIVKLEGGREDGAPRLRRIRQRDCRASREPYRRR